MIEATFVLLLVMAGERVEYTPYQSLSECLSVRRKIKRNVGPTNNFDQKWSCKELKVKIKDGEIIEFVN
jgi:hypothetical protein|tara:strand:- start:9397 stop:9603 length:207 start_codon:yes stop_codon:yes gene_type:complete